MFDPQEFFPSCEEILHLRNEPVFRSSSSTIPPGQPQAIEIGENYHGAPDTSYARHEEQIKDILNHLDELSLDHIKEMKDKIEGLPPKEHQHLLHQLMIRCHPTTSTEGAVGLICWFERTESVFSHSNCTEDCKVKFAAGTLTEYALSWKIEDKFYNLVVKGNDLKTYARRFQELATLCPNMVSNNEKLMEVSIGGLPQSIEGTVTASKPQTLEEVINKAQRLLNQVLKHGSVQGINDHKQKFDD
ncbi:hypothetical protein Tco_0436393 [Tanacetum coccineum]